MNNDEFLYFLTGVLLALVVALVMVTTLGHKTFDSVDDIPAPDLYRIVIDDKEFVCQRAPIINGDSVVLKMCDGMPMDDVRIKRTDSVAFYPIERGE